MADWTSIDVNSLLPGQPFTSAIALAYEENPRAIADGATGAPGISGDSFANDFNIDPEKKLPVVSVTAADTARITQGLRKIITSFSGTSEKDVVNYTNLAYTGSIRFTAIYSDEDSGDQARLYKNGTLVSSFGQNGSPASVDVSVTTGDTFKWTLQSGGVGGGTLAATEFASDGYGQADAYLLLSNREST